MKGCLLVKRSTTEIAREQVPLANIAKCSLIGTWVVNNVPPRTGAIFYGPHHTLPLQLCHQVDGSRMFEGPESPLTISPVRVGTSCSFSGANSQHPMLQSRGIPSYCFSSENLLYSVPVECTVTGE